MVRKRTAFIGVICVGTLVGVASTAQADTPLTHADVHQLRNQVDFISENGAARLAQLDDRLEPGDALSTRQSSFAELEFNDGSLARVGELVLFRFKPNTRTFELDNGTLLLLIPPAQGTSRLRTPNASAGIRGSGLFARYIEGESPDQSVTLVGALTTSGISVSNGVEALTWNTENDSFTHTDAATDLSKVELEAGHVAVIVGNKAPQVFSFDIDLFYRTSALVSGLDLDGDGDTSGAIWTEDLDDNVLLSAPISSENGGLDAIAPVRQETVDGLSAQAGTLTGPYTDNPPFVYGGNWQAETVGSPTGQQIGSQMGPTNGSNDIEAIDELIDAADIQTPQFSLETVPPVGVPTVPPIEFPARLPGPIPIVGPIPSRDGNSPVPPAQPPVPPSVQPPTQVPPQPPVPPPGQPPAPTPTPLPEPTPVQPVVPAPVQPPAPDPVPPPAPVPTPSPSSPDPDPDPDPSPSPPQIIEPPVEPTPSLAPFSPQSNQTALPGNSSESIMGPEMEPEMGPEMEPEMGPEMEPESLPGSTNVSSGPQEPSVDEDSSAQTPFQPPGIEGPPVEIENAGNGDNAPVFPNLEETGINVGPNPD